MKVTTKAKLAKLPKANFVWSAVNLFYKNSFLYKSGWYKSVWRGSSIDKNGLPIPWIVYTCIYFLEPRLNKRMTVFEWGSGNSTLWWAKRTNRVVAVEHNQTWFKKMKKVIPPNVTVRKALLQGTEYESAILSEKSKFDIIIIDGRRRIKCAKTAVQRLKANGIILWDNSERDRYSEGIKFLQEDGFKKLDFIGPIPISHRTGQTTIFYKTKNILNI